MGIFERIISSLENFGYRAANFSHKVTVSALAVGAVYGFYGLLKDYRIYFKARKNEEYIESLEERDELLRQLIEERDDKN